MTLRELLAAVARRWYVLAAVLALTAGLGASFAQDGGVFSTKTLVTFTLPSVGALAPDNGSQDASVIAFAGAVATEINRGKPTPRYSSGDAPYYGAGVREGVLVSLRDDGSQWGSSFGSAVIEIQIVGQTHDAVADRQATILAQIDEIVAAQLGTTPAADERIVSHVEPLTTDIAHITSSRPAQLAAVAALSIAGLLAGGWGAASIDRIVRRRARRRVRSLAEGKAA
jgi:hypothetical protein